MKERIRIEGAMVERALTRLASRGVRVEKVKRISPRETECIIDGRAWASIQALFPKKSGGAYRVERLGAVGAFAPVLALVRRTGVLLGGLVFLLVTLFAETLILKIEIKTDTPLQTEILRVLDESGVKPFRTLKEEERQSACAQIFALGGVSFCSLKKVGSTVIVEVRGSSFSKVTAREKVFVAKRSGTLLSLVVLRGKALAAVGDTVGEGQTLAVGEGEREFVVARARLACVYEGVWEEEDEKRAFAQALLAVYGEGVKIKNTQLKTQENGVFVRIEYEYAFSINYTED